MEDPAHTNNEVRRLCGLIRGLEIEHTIAATVQAGNLSRILTHEERGPNVAPENQVEALGVLVECFTSRNVDWRRHVNLVPVAIAAFNFALDYSKDYADDDDEDDDHHEMARTCLVFFTKMATTFPDFFNTNIHEVLERLPEILEDGNLDPEIRTEVARVLNIIADSRNDPNLKHMLFNLSMELLHRMEDVPHMWQTNRQQYAGWNWDTDVGVSVLDMIADSLSEDIAAEFVGTFEDSVTHENWKHRYAKILAFAEISERCQELMENVMEELVPMIATAFVDEHSRVRYRAIKTIGSIYGRDVSGAGDWKGTCLPTVILPVVYALDDAENPMIQV